MLSQIHLAIAIPIGAYIVIGITVIEAKLS